MTFLLVSIFLSVPLSISCSTKGNKTRISRLLQNNPSADQTHPNVQTIYPRPRLNRNEIRKLGDEYMYQAFAHSPRMPRTSRTKSNHARTKNKPLNDIEKLSKEIRQHQRIFKTKLAEALAGYRVQY